MRIEYLAGQNELLGLYLVVITPRFFMLFDQPLIQY
jgi:hypothetical protein